MKYLLPVILAIALLNGCDTGTEGNGDAGFITLLGNDTLAVEQFTKTEEGIQARVVLRSPSTSFASYSLSLDSLGGIAEMTRRSHTREERFEGDGEVVQTVTRSGDSLRVEFMSDEGMQTRTVAYEEGVVPFIDMVHWPFELAFNRAAEMEADSIDQPMLTGTRISNFIIWKADSDSMTLRHPTRGVMGVTVDGEGNLQVLDAGQTTRKLTVERHSSVDIEGIGERFATMDERGNPFGELSGAEEGEFSFNGAEFHVSYGSPSKRGRTIFGGIVPYGERWRTGANRATHFETSADLTIGDLEVPAGEYTLFTIPEEDGGILMINRQTGQNGQSYDPERDLGRVPMEVETKDDVTEHFTITVEEQGEGGVLKLIWDRTVYSVDFEIQ